MQSLVTPRRASRERGRGDASFHLQSRSGSLDPGSELQDGGERAGKVSGRNVSGPPRAPADETVGPDEHGAVGLDPVERLEAAGRRLEVFRSADAEHLERHLARCGGPLGWCPRSAAR